MSQESPCTPERIRHCNAACCRVGFHLTDEEVRAGHVSWHPDYPFHILQVGDDHRCVHLDVETRRCAVYDDRPSACRHFDCRVHGLPAAD